MLPKLWKRSKYDMIDRRGKLSHLSPLLRSYVISKGESEHGRALFEKHLKEFVFWRDTDLKDLGLRGIPLILADIFLVNSFTFIKNILSVYF